jgi:uncharacterized protein with FMN-binding domain
MSSSRPMRRALPAIAVSAAGLTWLLHAQGVIDSAGSVVSAGASPDPPGATARSAVPSTTTPPTTRSGFGGDDEEGQSPSPRQTTTTTQTPITTARAPAASGNKTLTGPTVDTRWGPVQVQVVVDGSKLVDVKAVQYPTHASRSAYISEQALPMLHDEAMSAQSANIDIISGATYTADGYAQSLQAALDQAGFRN